MKKVIGINLNGHAYHLEEGGYEALRDYLAQAEQQLEDNPDRAEIMSDLEQAIADKCQKYLGPHKTVVSASEVAQIVAEMGPVDATADQDGGSDGASGARDSGKQQHARPRRLHRIPDGAMIAGVCNGIAAYFQVDVTLVRIGFVAAAIMTKGVSIMAYVVLMFAIPEANTPETRAAAGGMPLNAREVVDRAKRHYAEGAKHWRRHWQQQRRQWRRYGAPRVPFTYGLPPWAAVVLPIFGLAHLVLFLVMAAMMVSLVNTGGVLDWQLPPDVPIWAGALILLIGYQIAVSPLRAVHHWSFAARAGIEPAWFPFWNAVLWLVGLAFGLWIASNHIPEITEFVQRFPELVLEFAEAVRNLIDRQR
jgi:phage shock protein PspC (stress-responsive transcriptional regulator)